MSAINRLPRGERLEAVDKFTGKWVKVTFENHAVRIGLLVVVAKTASGGTTDVLVLDPTRAEPLWPTAFSLATVRAMTEAWERHCRDYPDADPDYFRRYGDDMALLPVSVGTVLRDGDPL